MLANRHDLRETKFALTTTAFILSLALWPASASASDQLAEDPKPAAGSEAQAADQEEARFWSLINHSEDPEDYRVFLESFPDGRHAEEARDRITQLNGGDGDTSQPQSTAAAKIESMEGTYVVQCNANLRDNATVKSSKLGLLAGGRSVQVTGKVSGRNWYKIKTAGGTEGFVFGPLLRPAKAALAQSKAPAPAKVAAEPEAAVTTEGSQ